MYLESKPSDSSRDISKSPYYECRVRGNFCERSEEKTINYVVAVDMRNGCSAQQECGAAFSKNSVLRAAEYHPGCALIRDLQGDHRLKL